MGTREDDTRDARALAERFVASYEREIRSGRSTGQWRWDSDKAQATLARDRVAITARVTDLLAEAAARCTQASRRARMKRVG